MWFKRLFLWSLFFLNLFTVYLYFPSLEDFFLFLWESVWQLIFWKVLFEGFWVGLDNFLKVQWFFSQSFEKICLLRKGLFYIVELICNGDFGIRRIFVFYALLKRDFARNFSAEGHFVWIVSFACRLFLFLGNYLSLLFLSFLCFLGDFVFARIKIMSAFFIFFVGSKMQWKFLSFIWMFLRGFFLLTGELFDLTSILK